MWLFFMIYLVDKSFDTFSKWLIFFVGFPIAANLRQVEWWNNRVTVISAKNHKRQRRKRQSVTAKREKSQTSNFVTAILSLPNLT